MIVLRSSLLSLVGLFALIVGVTEASGQPRGAMMVETDNLDDPLPLYQKSYALVIGIDAYSDGWPRLRNAVTDAEAVADALYARGFDVTLKTNLGSAELEDAVEEFIFERGREPEARLFIWFAGHGHTVGEEAYLVPADAPPPATDWQFRRRALSLRDFGRFMREVRSKHVLAIFDSCFAGDVFAITRARPSAAVTRSTVLPVRQMISSGDAGQTVSDDGLFRKLFLDTLSGAEWRADADGDGYLTGSELGLFLADKVTTLTHSRQTPRYGELNALGFDRGDFVFRVGVGLPQGPGGANGMASAPAPELRSLPPGIPADGPFAEFFEEFFSQGDDATEQREASVPSASADSVTSAPADGLTSPPQLPPDSPFAELFERFFAEGAATSAGSDRQQEVEPPAAPDPNELTLAELPPPAIEPLPLGPDELRPFANGEAVASLFYADSEAEAVAQYRGLQQRHPDLLGNFVPLIRSAELGKIGIRYNVNVGPFAEFGHALTFCNLRRDRTGAEYDIPTTCRMVLNSFYR